MLDDCPDEAKDQFRISIHNVIAADVHQFDLQTTANSKGQQSADTSSDPRQSAHLAMIHNTVSQSVNQLRAVPWFVYSDIPHMVYDGPLKLSSRQSY